MRRNVTRYPRRGLTDAVFAMNHERFFRPDRQAEMKLAGSGFERLPLAIPNRAPVPVPDALLFKARTRDARSLAIQALFIPEMLSCHVCQRGVSQVQILHIPGGLAVALMAFTLAKEDQFESETLPCLVGEVAGVIPPLCAEVWMFKMVARKRIPVSRQRLAILHSRHQ